MKRIKGHPSPISATRRAWGLQPLTYRRSRCAWRTPRCRPGVKRAAGTQLIWIERLTISSRGSQLHRVVGSRILAILPSSVDHSLFAREGGEQTSRARPCLLVLLSDSFAEVAPSPSLLPTTEGARAEPRRSRLRGVPSPRILRTTIEWLPDPPTPPARAAIVGFSCADRAVGARAQTHAVTLRPRESR